MSKDASLSEAHMVPRFTLPVDSEHKATVLRIWKVTGPHMIAFHLSWLAFFAAFLSTFAPAAMLPVIRDNLGLTKTDIGNAGIAAVCGAIFARVALGNFLDMYGPRYGMSIVLGLSAPAVFCIGLSTNAAGFIISRLLIGFSLAVFVACQYWCSNMFNTRIVGSANAFAAGWGNMGGGFCHLVMPLIFSGIKMNAPAFQAWRWAFFVPGGFQVLLLICTMLLAQDLPDGNFAELKKAGTIKTGGSSGQWKAAVFNYRTWVMTLTYGYCFGVELTVDNVISQYMYDNFHLELEVAGLLGSVFGMLNLFSRASGGVVSDLAAARWGMRGRIWVLWIGQTLGGVFCVAMGLVSHSLVATMVILVVFSLFCQASCGLSFGVVPFVSKRSTGLVSGFVGAGGNAGGAVTQAIFFTYGTMTVPQGFLWMGVMTVAVTSLYLLMYFPQWGGAFVGPKSGVTEEDYYLSEYTPTERAEGMHSASLKFAFESRSQRGKPFREDAKAQVAASPVGAEVAPKAQLTA